MKKLLTLSFILILLIPFCLHSEEESTKNEFNIKEFDENYKYHTSLDLIEILGNSSINYKLEEGDSTTFMDLVGERDDNFIGNPNLVLEKNENNQTYLKILEPKDEIIDLFLKAENKLLNEEYEELIKIYEKALKVDDTYFKTWTNLGDSYFLNGEYKKAIKYFKKAIELNEIGYQEYWFLADTYFKLGKYDLALENIINAYILNPHNENMKWSLYGIASVNNLYIRDNRTKFPFIINKQSEEKCVLTYNSVDGLNWLPFSYVCAAWMMEDSFIEINEHFIQQGIFNQLKLKEMLIVQYAFIATKLEENKEISNHERFIYNVLHNGYLTEYILWEIVEQKMPTMILLLPKETRDRIYEYLSKFVFCEIEKK